MPPPGVQEHRSESCRPMRVRRYKPVCCGEGFGGMMECRPKLNTCVQKNQTAERPARGNRPIIFVEGKYEHSLECLSSNLTAIHHTGLEHRSARRANGNLFAGGDAPHVPAPQSTKSFAAVGHHSAHFLMMDQPPKAMNRPPNAAFCGLRV
jgi:hypothetical protein